MLLSLRKFLGTFLVAVAIVIIWELLHLKVGSNALSSPIETMIKLGQMLASGELTPHIVETLSALIYALIISIIGGISLGILLGTHRLTGNVAEPILLNMYSIPKVTLYPLVLLIFGLGMSAKVAFGVMHGLIPILVFTMNAIRQMKPVYLRTARTLHTPFNKTIIHVLIPAILPEIVSGLRLGFSLTLLGVLIGEMFASQKGLGYLITNAMALGDISTIMAIAVLLTVFAVICNGLLMLLGRNVQTK